MSVFVLVLQQTDAESDAPSAVAAVCGHAGFLSAAPLQSHLFPVCSSDPLGLFLLLLTSLQSLNVSLL